MIKVDNISKNFSDKLIFRDISFDISNGDSVAIIGQSGVGKSVLLKHLNGLLKPDTGEVWVNNVLLNEIKNYNLDILKKPRLFVLTKILVFFIQIYYFFYNFFLF